MLEFLSKPSDYFNACQHNFLLSLRFAQQKGFILAIKEFLRFLHQKILDVFLRKTLPTHFALIASKSLPFFT
jgi:hypothetical protein